jgi:hypothetical protein
MCWFYWNTILCISLCIIFPCTLTAKYIIFETTVQIPEVEYAGKYGHMRANTDMWGQIQLYTLKYGYLPRMANNQHWLLVLLNMQKRTYCNQICDNYGYSLDVVIFEGYSPLNNRVIQWTCVFLEVIHRWRRLEAKISRLFYFMWLSFNQYNWFFIMWGITITVHS